MMIRQWWRKKGLGGKRGVGLVRPSTKVEKENWLSPPEPPSLCTRRSQVPLLPPDSAHKEVDTTGKDPDSHGSLGPKWRGKPAMRCIAMAGLLNLRVQRKMGQKRAPGAVEIPPIKPRWTESPNSNWLECKDPDISQNNVPPPREHLYLSLHGIQILLSAYVDPEGPLQWGLHPAGIPAQGFRNPGSA